MNKNILDQIFGKQEKQKKISKYTDKPLIKNNHHDKAISLNQDLENIDKQIKAQEELQTDVMDVKDIIKKANKRSGLGFQEEFVLDTKGGVVRTLNKATFIDPTKKSKKKEQIQEQEITQSNDSYDEQDSRSKIVGSKKKVSNIIQNKKIKFK